MVFITFPYFLYKLVRGRPLSKAERNAKTNEDLAGAVSARRLDWTDLDADIKAAGDDLRPHSFDTIVGTDVVFAKSLVAPLLGCLARMAHKKSRIYLCLQVRCEDAHAMLLRSAKRFGLRIEDCSDELRKMPSCSWGIDLECKLLRIAVERSSTLLEVCTVAGNRDVLLCLLRFGGGMGSTFAQLHRLYHGPEPQPDTDHDAADAGVARADRRRPGERRRAPLRLRHRGRAGVHGGRRRLRPVRRGSGGDDAGVGATSGARRVRRSGLAERTRVQSCEKTRSSFVS